MASKNLGSKGGKKEPKMENFEGRTLSDGFDFPLYQMTGSGLIHTADSLAPTREGRFVKQFGPPDNPEEAPRFTEAGELVKNAPKLGTRFMQGGGGTIGNARKKDRSA